MGAREGKGKGRDLIGEARIIPAVMRALNGWELDAAGDVVVVVVCRRGEVVERINGPRNRQDGAGVRKVEQASRERICEDEEGRDRNMYMRLDELDVWQFTERGYTAVHLPLVSDLIS